MNKDYARRRIAEFIRSKNWSFRQHENNQFIFKMGFNLDCRFGRTTFIIDIKDRCYLAYAILELKSKSDVMVNVSRFLHLANYGLFRGNFEFDESDGEVRYKMHVSYADLKELPDAMIEESIVIPCLMLDKYGNSLMKVFNNPSIDVVKEYAECESSKGKSMVSENICQQ